MGRDRLGISVIGSRVFIYHILFPVPLYSYRVHYGYLLLLFLSLINVQLMPVLSSHLLDMLIVMAKDHKLTTQVIYCYALWCIVK
jgi:hypothetical protein